MPDLGQLLADALAGRYRIERELGQGGMAIVYVAEDLRHHRKVAIKVLRTDAGTELGGERFLREIEIASALRHPHIIPLYDSGEADGRLFYVMPLVEGESLRARIDRERQLPIDDALRYAREVADALSYAHAHGVVHRDIKPENILIESDHAVVADFGIARAFAAAGPKGRLTGSGMSIGTPAYMSPEQAAGDRDVDGRSDLYSLGCVLYEMLAGQPPFSGATKESLVRQHIMTPPPPVTQFRPAVPAAVNDALMRALAKSPADRFNPVGQFAAAIGPVATTTASAVHPDIATRRARWPVVAAVVLVLAAAITWPFVARRHRTATDGGAARSIAVLPFDNLGGDTAVVPLLLGVHAEIVTQLAKVAGLAVASRNSALTYRNSDKSDRAIASELRVSSLLHGSIQRSGDQVHLSVSLTDAPNGKLLWAESYDRPYTTQNLFAVQGDIAHSVASALSLRLNDQLEQRIARAPTSNVEALDAYYRGLMQWDRRGAQENDTMAVKHLERAVALDPSFARAWGLLAQAHGWLLRRGFVEDTLAAWMAVQRTQALAPGSIEAMLAAGYYRYYAQGDFAGALSDLAAADRLMPKSSEILTAMALLERRLNHWDRAIELLERAAQLEPRDASLAATLGETYYFMRRPADATRALDRAIALGLTNAPVFIAEYFVLASLLGDTARARLFVEREGPRMPQQTRATAAGWVALTARDFRTTLIEFKKRDTPVFSTAPHHYLMLARTAAASGDSVRARAYADTLIRNARAELARIADGPRSDLFGRRSATEAQMAVALAIRGERDRAVRLAESSTRRYGAERDAVGGAALQIYLAATYMHAGHHADAIGALRRVLAIPSEISVSGLRLDPLWDGLRGEPEFQRLLAEQR